MKTRNNIAFTAFVATASISSFAAADFNGFSGQDTLRYYGADGSTASNLAGASYAVLDMYANFSGANTHGFNNEDSHMLAMFDGNFSANGFSLFSHSDIAGGSWKPSFSFDIPGTSNPTVDSFVTIGGSVGAGAATNVTTPDPNLGTATNPDIFNENVGWFLNPPTSAQGDVIDFKVWVGRFVVSGAEARGGANFDVSGTVGYNYGESTGAYFGDGGGNFTFNIPAPGALALLGLGGLATRRRRG